LNKQDEVFLSRGEQKTASIVFWILQVLILVEQNNSPIILIDDISSELDQRKINLLIDFFVGLDVQIFITDIGNTLISIDEKNATTFEINNGHITRKEH
jgi:DNA replication and repair protein RecF